MRGTPQTAEEMEELRLAELVLRNFDRRPPGSRVQHTGEARIAIAKWGHLVKRMPPFVPPPGWFIDDV